VSATSGGASQPGLLRRVIDRLRRSLESEASEALLEQRFARLRHAIRHDPKHKDVRSVLVTSARDAEGKTTVSIGLARSFARLRDNWSILVETDMRRPSIARVLGLPPNPGLAGHIGDGVPLAEVIQPSPWPKMFVIAAGRRSDAASEDVASAQMRKVIEELKSRYTDRIIVIDAPPVLATAEPLSLSVFVDGVLLVVGAGKTPRSVVAEAVRALPSQKLLGVVLNGVRLGRRQRDVYYYDADPLDAEVGGEGPARGA